MMIKMATKMAPQNFDWLQLSYLWTDQAEN